MAIQIIWDPGEVLHLSVFLVGRWEVEPESRQFNTQVMLCHAAGPLLITAKWKDLASTLTNIPPIS